MKKLNMYDMIPVHRMIERSIGFENAKKFNISRLEQIYGLEKFRIFSDGNSVEIGGTSPSSAASGFSYYMKYYCKSHFSWCGNRIHLPDPLPRTEGVVVRETLFKHRYYLNYCTYSYSMAFWDWDRWEKEIDWMSMNGINLVLSILGHEEVWRRLLSAIGYTREECLKFLCGPAFFPWMWMQNLTSWGGPLPEWWFENRLNLAKKVHDRMLSLGISPVLNGYSGMVPADFKSKFPGAHIIDQGSWCGFARPSLLAPEDELFDKIATIFYEIQKSLFGDDIHYFCTDMFHEGGRIEGIDLSKNAAIVQKKMLEHNPQSIWVMQAWQSNPHKEIFDSIDKGKALILDLWCESNPTWRKRKAFYGTPWLWCIVENFGAKKGLYGNLELLAREPISVNKSENAGRMEGIGLAIEGIENNPVVYELLTETVWRNEIIEVDSWLDGYIGRRYGKLTKEAQKAWQLLKKSVYNCFNEYQEGGMESIVCARPGIDVLNVSTWGPKHCYYDKSLVKEACIRLFLDYEELKNADPYLYDLVDVTRQALADKAREYYEIMIIAYKSKDIDSFILNSKKFLNLIAKQDDLLSTRAEFLLGNWLESARKLGKTKEDKDLFEFNARCLITLWGPKEAAKVLHDYSHREWSGLISDFYYKRWELFIETLQAALVSKSEPADIDWYEWELEWVMKNNSYPTEPKGNIKEILNSVIMDYLSLLD